MRLVNRPLAFLFAAALGFAAVMVVVEVIAHAVGAPPVLFDWPTWYAWGERTHWSRVVVEVWSIVLMVAGGALVVAELTPARRTRVRLDSDDPRTDAAMTRRGLAGATRGAAESVEGVGRAAVVASRRRVSVTARSLGTDRSAAAALEQPVTDAVAAELERLGLRRSPRVRVRVEPKGA